MNAKQARSAARARAYQESKRRPAETISAGLSLPGEEMVPKRVWPAWSPSKVWALVPKTIPNVRKDTVGKPSPGELAGYIARDQAMKGKGHR